MTNYFFSKNVFEYIPKTFHGKSDFMQLTDYQRLGLLAILFLFVFTDPALSQDSRTNLVGVSVLGDYSPESSITPSLGFVFERKIGKRSGFETGLFYKTNKQNISFVIQDPVGGAYWETVEVRESYLSIPILYRFYAKQVTVSVGPVIDVFVGWDQISRDLAQVSSYEVNPSVEFGPLLKVSKPILLGEQLIMEPELRFGVMLNGYQTAFYGVGLQLKQQMLKKN